MCLQSRMESDYKLLYILRLCSMLVQAWDLREIFAHYFMCTVYCLHSTGFSTIRTQTTCCDFFSINCDIHQNVRILFLLYALFNSELWFMINIAVPVVALYLQVSRLICCECDTLRGSTDVSENRGAIIDLWIEKQIKKRSSCCYHVLIMVEQQLSKSALLTCSPYSNSEGTVQITYLQTILIWA
jgi:hypothetical protein